MYIRKQEYVNAFAFGIDLFPQWFREAVPEGRVSDIGEDSKGVYVVVRSNAGNMVARQGDYIIQKLTGDIYTCKQDVFKQTYEIV